MKQRQTRSNLLGRLYNQWLNVALFLVLSSLFYLFLVSSKFALAAAPTFTLTQDNKTVSITDTTGLSGFSYFTATSNPNCTSGKTTGWTTDADGSISDADTGVTISDGTWVCFKAKNVTNDYGYAELEVDLTKPVITVSQDNAGVYAVADVIFQAGENAGKSIDVDGEYLAVGAPGADGYGTDGTDGSGTGAVYIFKRVGRAWAFQQKITDEATGFTALKSNDTFGGSVALSGNLLAVGAEDDDGYGTTGTDGTDTGAVYIFKRTGSTWTLEKEISDEQTGFTALKSGDSFGEYIALDGDRLAVGATRDDGVSNAQHTGAVYIFKRSVSGSTVTWALEKEISDTNGLPILAANDLFGGEVDLDGDRLAVGACGDDGYQTNAGAVYIFKRTTSGNTVTWTLEHTIYDGSGNLTTLSTNDCLASVSMDGEYLAAGAYGDKSYTGAVYIFKRSTSGNTTTWTREETLYDASGSVPNLTTGDWFGSNVSLSGDYLAVSAHADGGYSGSYTGATYLFKRDGRDWDLEREIVDTQWPFASLDSGDFFGWDLALDGKYLVVGGPYFDGKSGSNGGSVYFFKRSGDTWFVPSGYVWYPQQQMPSKRRFSATDLGVGVLPSSYQNFKTTSTTTPVCDATTADSKFGTAGQSAGNKAVSASDHGKWICFRAKNDLGVYGYGRWQVDLTSPTVTISQDSDSVDASGMEMALKESDNFGREVALDGDYMAVGAPGIDGHSGEGTGAVYIFKRVDGVWVLKQEITDQATGFTRLKAYDNFGGGVALDGAYLAVGAPYDDGSSGSSTGAIYIFKRTGENWAFEREISDGTNGFNNLRSGDIFGWQIDLDGDYLVVGSYTDKGSSGNHTGAAYIFKRSGTAWTLQQEISDRSGSLPGLRAYDSFGASVSISGDYIAVGATGDDDGAYYPSNPHLVGAVYVYKRSGSTWIMKQKIFDKIKNFTNLKSFAQFGASVSLDGDRLAVGGWNTTSNSTSSSGGAWIFKRTGETWNLEREFADQATGFTALERSDYFGWQVDLDGTRLVVAAPNDDGDSGSNTGAAYVFKRTGTTWALEQEISDTGSGFMSLQAGEGVDLFVLDGDYLVAGSNGDNGYSDQYTGAVYTFKRQSDNTWDLEQELSEMTFAESSSWQSFKTTGSTDPNCSDTNTKWSTATTGSAAKSVAITSTDASLWACFRVKNPTGIYSYTKYQVDYSGPHISVTQDNTTLTASSKSSDLDASTWQYVLFSTGSCGTGITTGWQSGNSVSSVSHGSNYCF